MPHINIEIKAKSDRHEQIRKILLEHHADFKGIDHQIDTYFLVPNGRLKLREGNIENNVIFYHRNNESGPKQSDVTLYKPTEINTLKHIFASALGVKTVVNKQREIYFIENVKFHLDTVEQLGTFVEIEAIDSTGAFSISTLRQQCEKYIQLFGIQPNDLLEHSYSDMLMKMV